MTKNEIISIIAKQRLIEETVMNVAKSADDQLKDLAQDLYIDLMAKDDDKIVNLYETGQLKYFVTRMVVNNIRSKNSPFWCNYKRFTNNMNEINGDIVDE